MVLSRLVLKLSENLNGFQKLDENIRFSKVLGFKIVDKNVGPQINVYLVIQVAQSRALINYKK